MKRIHVLITGGGTVTCQSVIKGLRKQHEIETRITTVDANPDSTGRYLSDDFHVIPVAKHPDFIPSLLEICKREKVDLLIPIVDYEFLPIAENKRRFEEGGCRVAISDPETIRTCNEKDLTYR